MQSVLQTAPAKVRIPRKSVFEAKKTFIELAHAAGLSTREWSETSGDLSAPQIHRARLIFVGDALCSIRALATRWHEGKLRKIPQAFVTVNESTLRNVQFLLLLVSFEAGETRMYIVPTSALLALAQFRVETQATFTIQLVPQRPAQGFDWHAYRDAWHLLRS